MATDWTIISQYPDVETNGGSVARDVMVVGTLTTAHNVYFENRYPAKGFTAKTPLSNSKGFTIVFEQLFTIPNVAAVTWGQELNAANQLVDYVTVYYTSTSGNSDNFVKVLFSVLTQTHVADLVAAGVAILDANEAH
jgi:hypothetical protein